MKIGRAKALWKVPELWKNQKAVFPQLLGPSVHTSHNAGCYWTFLKHNFPSTPRDRTGDELPAELGRRETRLRRIQEAKRALEERAKRGSQE